MASLLRSSKFVRYFAGFARNIVFNSARETEYTFNQPKQCICGNFSSPYVTAAAVSNQNLEKSLKRLDQDVKRSGRISRRDIEEILDEIRAHKSATSSQSLLVIRCCGNLVPEELPEIRTALVQEIWKTLNNLNVPMDVSHYNALLRVYLENEHKFSPTEFLVDLEAKGIEPNRVTYQRLISRYCQDGDIEGATRILEFMREKQLPVNENVFNALIMGHSQSDDLQSASGILIVMKQAGLEPSADTYTTLLCGYARRGDIETISKLMQECEDKEIYLLDKDILDIIYALATNGHANLVDGLIGKIRKTAGYNQDAVNNILRLINKGQEDVALKLLKTMPRASRTDGELINTGNFLVRHLVKAKRPIDNILRICSELEDNKMNSKALLLALESALVNGITDMAVPLLQEIKKHNLPIRQHYFWPLLCNAKNPDEVLKIIETMITEFEINPSSETVREYVIPNLQGKKDKGYEKIIQLLRNAGVSISNACTSSVFAALIDNNMKAAAEIALNHRVYYSPSLFRKPLSIALFRTKDYDNYIKIVRQMYDNLSRLEAMMQSRETAVENDEYDQNKGEMLGQLIYDVLLTFRQDAVPALETILQGFVDQGLTVSNNQAEKIQEKMGSSLTTTISELLGKLSSGDLEPILVEKPLRIRSDSTMSIPQLEKLIHSLDEKKENTNGLKKQLINLSIKSNDVQKTAEIMEKLSSDTFVITAGLYAQVLDLYSTNNHVDESLNIVQKIKDKEPDFLIDLMKLVKVAQALVNANRFDECLKFLVENKREKEKPEERTFNYNATCWRLLNTLAEAGKVEEINKLFDCLVGNGYIAPNNVVLGPLVKVHILKNDVESAMKVFEEISQKYRVTPWKHEIACRLIQNEDATNLQRLTDLSTDIHGEVNSLYDLVFSFIECGRIRQARKILETPGLRTRHQRINQACERYQQEGMTESLEGLMEATKDLNHIDRGDIYYNLLLNYIKAKEPEKALGLWTKMQEEDIQPQDVFLIKLADFLKENEFEVPFVVPAASEIPQTPAPSVQKTTQRSTSRPPQKVVTTQKAETPAKELSPTASDLKQAIKTGDVDAILSAKSKLKETDKLTITERSLIVEACVKAERLTEATKQVLEMLETNNHPIPRIFRFYLNKIANSGDLSLLKTIGEKLSSEMKKLVSFDNRLCHAYVASGKSEQYLEQLENNIDNAKTPEEIKLIGEKFPRGGAAGILDGQPTMVDKFEKIAEKYAEKQILGPMNVLWMHYFINDKQENADQIWKKHLNEAPRLMFQRVVHLARETQNEKLVEKLVDQLKNTKVSEGALGNAYSCLIDILSAKNQFENALKALEKAKVDVCLEHINRTALIRLKEGVEKLGKPFPYQIPARQAKAQEPSSSSSSSSDDESKKKQLA